MESGSQQMKDRTYAMATRRIPEEDTNTSSSYCGNIFT